MRDKEKYYNYYHVIKKEKEKEIIDAS